MSGPFRSSLLPPRVTVPLMALAMTWTGLRVDAPVLSLCGLVLAVAALLARAASAHLRRGLRAGRRHPPRVFEQGTALVDLRVENHSWLPLAGVEVRDSFPPAEQFRVSLMDRRTLGPRRGVALRFRRVCVRHRGVYTLGPLRAGAADPLGLFPFEVELPVLTDLYVYPQAEGLAFFPLLGDGTLRRTGEEILPEAGDSVEFRGVRDWRPSDGVRRVHWPTTARHGRLMARECEEDVVTEVTLVLDLRRDALTGLGSHSTLEFAVKAAAALAQTAIERHHLVQLWGVGAGPRCHVPFGSGAHHLNTLLDCLTVVRADGGGSYTEGFAPVVPTLRRGATLVALLSAAAFDIAAMEPTLRALVLDGVRLVAVVLDDRSFLSLFPSQFDLHRDAPELAAIHARLRALGAEVFAAAEGDDLRQRLEMPLS